MLATKLALHDVVNYISLRGVNLNQVDPENKTLLAHYLLNTEEMIKRSNKQIKYPKLMEYVRRLV